MKRALKSDGTALVIHAQADGMTSDPAGDAGDRIACGTMVRSGAYLIVAGNGVIDPVLIRDARPEYTDAAMRRSIQGDIEMDAIVQPNGLLTDIRVTRSLDAVYGLDQEAVECVKQWRFRPGTKDGQPVPVGVTLTIQFRLH